MQTSFNQPYRRLMNAVQSRLFKTPPGLLHRRKGYQLLSGQGLEIGALHQPAPLPSRCKVFYLDHASKQDSAKMFPEVDANLMVEVDFLADVDKDDLISKVARTFDFVILNHVIEHVANPLRFIEQAFRLGGDNARIVISAPDKNFTFDKSRKLTTFEHLLAEYQTNVMESTEEHYLDFLKGVHPEVFANEDLLQKTLADVKKRREHVHVWDSDSFKHFMERAFSEVLHIKARLIFESPASQNGGEYFSVWEKTTLS